MKQIQQLQRHGAEQRRGAALIEMAVCFPVFILILLGIIEFGRALMVSQMLTNAAREACRVAVMDDGTNSAVETMIDDLVSNTTNVSASQISTSISVTDRLSGAVDESGTAIESAASRDLVEIEIMLPADAVSYTPGRFLSGGTLRGRCAMRKE